IPLLLSACGTGIPWRSEGDPCVSGGQCPAPKGDLACFYGICRRSCGAKNGCPAGTECTCAGGWAPVALNLGTAGPPRAPGGVCLAHCASDADCTGLKRCRPKTQNELSGPNDFEEVCAPATAHCAPDAFCHPECDPGVAKVAGAPLAACGQEGGARDEC